MSIDNEILRIKNAKTAIRNAVIARGGTLTEDQLIDDYAAAVTALPTETDVDLDFVTATANDILSGKVGADVNGLPVNGNIRTVTAELTDNVVTFPKGYIETAQTLTVAEAKAPTVSGNAVTVYKGYQAAQDTVEIAKVTATRSDNVVTIPAGYHDANTVTVPEAGAVSVSGNVVTIPAGYNANQQTKTVGTAKGVATYTPSTADQTIAADTYLSGVQTIKGDVNLIADNIAEGVEIFGVAGTHQGGSSMDFYKCRAVHEAQAGGVCYIISGCPTAEANGTYLPTEYTTPDGIDNTQPVYSNGTYYYYYCENGDGWIIGTDYTSSSSLYIKGSSWFDSSDYTIVDGMTMTESTVAPSSATWDGYKAVLTDGFYSFEETLTTGLTYGNALTPVPGSIYNGETTVRVASLRIPIPEDGLIFYAPLAQASSTAETGQALTTSGDVTYSTVDGVPCAVFDGSCYLYGTENLISGAEQFSYSLWVKPQSTSAIQWFGSVGNTSGQGTCFLTGIRFAGKYSGGFYYYDNSESPVNADTSKWTHLLFTYDGATLKTYANGAWQHDFSVGAMNLQNGWTIGCMAGSRYDERMSGYVAAVRVYDRVVTAEEIQQLAGEFAV